MMQQQLQATGTGFFLHNESDEVSLGFFSELQDLGTYVLSKEDWYGSYFCCVGKF